MAEQPRHLERARHIGRVTIALAAARVRADAQYRGSLALLSTTGMFVVLLDLATILILFVRIDDMLGWTQIEVVFLYALARLAFDASDLLVGSLEVIDEMVRDGRLDRTLVRPIDPLWQIVGDHFAVRRVLRLAAGAVVMLVTIGRLHAGWNLAEYAFLVWSFVVAVTIFSSVWLLTGAASVWLVKASETRNAFTYGGSFLTQYPTTMFNGWVRGALVFVIPFAFVAYVPGARLLDKPSFLPGWAAYLGPVAATAILSVAVLTWRFALRSYRSTGS